MKSALWENGPGAAPFRVFHGAQIAESRSMVSFWATLFLVARVVFCECSGWSNSDVGEGKEMHSGWRVLISSDASSVIVAVGVQDCMSWLATPRLSASAAARAERESVELHCRKMVVSLVVRCVSLCRRRLHAV